MALPGAQTGAIVDGQHQHVDRTRIRMGVCEHGGRLQGAGRAAVRQAINGRFGRGGRLCGFVLLGSLFPRSRLGGLSAGARPTAPAAFAGCDGRTGWLSESARDASLPNRIVQSRHPATTTIPPIANIATRLPCPRLPTMCFSHLSASAPRTEKLPGRSSMGTPLRRRAIHPRFSHPLARTRKIARGGPRRRIPIPPVSRPTARRPSSNEAEPREFTACGTIIGQPAPVGVSPPPRLRRWISGLGLRRRCARPVWLRRSGRLPTGCRPK